MLGGGSNLVVADEGFPGVVVLAGARGAEFAAAGDAVDVTAQAGHDWDDFVRDCLAHGLSGVECLSGIPGRAGATPIQNVNAYGQDVADTIISVRVYDRLSDQVVVMPAADCGFGYRTSVFKRQSCPAAGRGCRDSDPAAATGRFVIVAVTFRLPASPLSAPVRYGELSRVLGVADGDRVPLAAARAAVLGLRRSKGMVLAEADPDTRSAGSFLHQSRSSARRSMVTEARLAARFAASGGPGGSGAGGGKLGGGGANAGGLDASAGIPHWPHQKGRSSCPRPG